MIEKINEDIKTINEKINTNDTNINKLFELLDKINEQRDEASSNIETLQLENQSYKEKIEKLEIVKDYLKENEEHEEEEV